MSTSIPALHVSTVSKATGRAKFTVPGRNDASHSGTFAIEINVHFDPSVDDYPAGPLTITSDLTDALKEKFIATTVDLVNTHGRRSPTVTLTGRCQIKDPNGEARKFVGLRYWLLIADNSRDPSPRTPDIASFVIIDHQGDRVAYGTGTTASGNLSVQPV